MVADDLEREADRAFPDETGGLLLGYRAAQGDVIVTQMTGPGPQALHRPKSFVPDAPWQAANLAQRYADSGGYLEYLGDWHTHPDGQAVLSRPDRRTLYRIAAHVAARCPDPVMIILAGRGPWHLAAFYPSPKPLRPTASAPMRTARYRSA